MNKFTAKLCLMFLFCLVSFAIHCMNNEIIASFKKNGFPCTENKVAWTEQNPRAALFLFMREAFPYVRDDGNAGLAYWACEKGFAEIVEILIKCGVNVNERTVCGLLTYLEIANKKGHMEVMKVLVKNGVWVDGPIVWSTKPGIKSTVLEYGDLMPNTFLPTVPSAFYNELRQRLYYDSWTSSFVTPEYFLKNISSKYDKLPKELLAVLYSDDCNTWEKFCRFLRIGKTTPISLQNFCIHTLVQTKTEAGRKALGSALFHPVISDDVFKYLVLHVSKFEGTALVFKAINSVPGNETKKKVVRERYAKDVAAFNIDYFEEYTDNLDVLAQVRAQKVMERFGELEKLDKPL